MSNDDGDGPARTDLAALPADVLYCVCSFLDGQELVALAQAAKPLRDVANEPRLWRALLRRTYGLGQDDQEDGADEGRRWKRRYFSRRRQWAAPDLLLHQRLVLCARWEATALLRQLVRDGMAPDERDALTVEGMNVTHIACRYGGSPALVQLLVDEFGVDLNVKSKAALIHQDPVLRDHAPVVALNHHTALSLTVESGNVETVHWLLAHGALLDENECLRCLIVVHDADLAKLFLDKLKEHCPGGDWKDYFLGGNRHWTELVESALLVAIDRACLKDVGVLGVLLSHMPDRLKKRTSATLVTAIRAGRVDSVAELIKQGVPARSNPGECGPIEEAAEMGNLEIVKLLVENGADAGASVTYRGHAGENAHTIALRTHGKPEVVDFLRRAPSPRQKEADRVFNIAIAVAGVVLLLTIWWTQS